MKLSRAAMHRIAPLLAAVLLAGPSLADDRVIFENADDSKECGILLDGSMEGAEVDDRSYTTAEGAGLDVGKVSRGERNEIVAFQARRPVDLVEVIDWTEGDDVVTVAFRDEMVVPVCLWLLADPGTKGLNRAVASLVRMAAIWRDERTGLDLGEIALERDVPESTARPFLNFKCTREGCPEATQLREKIGFTDGMVNVYFVDQVDYGDGMSSGNGMWCGDGIVVMGSHTWGALLAHEFGHAFTLSHVDDMADFDQTNVMHSASDSRAYLTEGQLFRMHLEPLSVINTTYGLRDGLTTRTCGDYSGGSQCPLLTKRIWADGSFEPN